MATIIEIRRRGGQLVERITSEQSTLSIGRGYNNDVVVDDPFVCPHHIRLDATDNGWSLVDLGSVNGYQLKTADVSNSNQIHSGDQLHIGQLTLHVFNSKHTVAPTLKLNKTENRLKLSGRHWVWPFVILLALGTDVLSYWLQTSYEIKPATIANMMLYQLLGIAAVALLWAIISRIFRHRWHFFTHLSLWAIFMAIEYLANFVLDIIGYNLPSILLYNILPEIINLALLCAVIWCSLTLATNLRSRRRFWCVASIGLSLLFIQFLSSGLFNFDKPFSSLPDYQGDLKPPAVTLTPAQSPDTLEERLNTLFDEALEASQENP